jgi:uncharacterized protein (TIGR04255 family)
LSSPGRWAESIVDFAAPPVTEVVAGVSFANLGSEGIALLAEYWRETARSAFPELQVQPPYVVPFEQFNGLPGVPQVGLQGIQMLAGYPAPRFWAVGADGQELLQLQPDWFACNWRRVSAHDVYDRWAGRRAEFRRWYESLSEYVRRSTGSDLDPVSCEVTYINHISASGRFENHGDFGRVFDIAVHDLGLASEQVSVALRFQVPAEAGSDQVIGRLHVDISPALDQKSHPIYVMQLTVRGVPADKTTESVRRFLDRGREVIDEAFVGLTTNDMQREWGKSDD